MDIYLSNAAYRNLMSIFELLKHGIVFKTVLHA